MFLRETEVPDECGVIHPTMVPCSASLDSQPREFTKRICICEVPRTSPGIPSLPHIYPFLDYSLSISLGGKYMTQMYEYKKVILVLVSSR